MPRRYAETSAEPRLRCRAGFSSTALPATLARSAEERALRREFLCARIGVQHIAADGGGETKMRHRLRRNRQRR